jgi:hypothetical protein
MSVRCLQINSGINFLNGPTHHYTPAVSRDGAAIAAIQIYYDRGCMRFSSMHPSNYSIRLHSPCLRTHWELPHSARRHLSHAINTLLLHVEVLLVQHGGGGAIF